MRADSAPIDQNSYEDANSAKKKRVQFSVDLSKITDQTMTNMKSWRCPINVE